MRTSCFRGIVAGGIAVALFGIAIGAWCAPVPSWPLQNFDGNICGWSGYGGLTLSYDPAQDDTGDGGGSCRFSTDFSGTGYGLFQASINNVSCCFCDLGVTLELTNYVSVDFDVKWDNSSTVPLSYFNSTGYGSPGGQPFLIEIGYTTISSFVIPDAATNGWAHVSAAINPALTNTFGGFDFYKGYTRDGSSNAAFWVDNVKLVGRGSLVTVSPVSCQGSRFTLQWNTTSGSTYTVQRSTDMTGWTNLVTGYPPSGATSGTLSYTDTNSPPGHALYRISSP
jgi:hypothetical protein